MLRSFSSWIPRDRGPRAGRAARRRRRGFTSRLEPLEGRDLLSTAGIGVPDQPPVLAPFGTQSVEEGNTLTLRATATDPNAGHTITYSLDPGAPAGATIDPSSGLFSWTPPNVQQTYAITVRATDSGVQGLSDTKILTVMVFDVPPGVQAGTNATIDQGTDLVRSGSFSDPNPDTWSATVDYGDGSGPRPLALTPGKTFQLDHTYTTPGNYTVSVTVNDSQGGQGHGYFAVQVQPSSTPTPSQPTPTQNPGQSSSGTGQSPTLANLGATQNLPLVGLKHGKVRFPLHFGRGHKHH